MLETGATWEAIYRCTVRMGIGSTTFHPLSLGVPLYSSSLAVFSNRDLDPLARKYLAQWRARNHARKLLGTKYFKCITVSCCQYRCPERSNINQTVSQTELTLRPHTEVLQHEPEAQLALVVIQLERVDR